MDALSNKAFLYKFFKLTTLLLIQATADEGQ